MVVVLPPPKYRRAPPVVPSALCCPRSLLITMRTKTAHKNFSTCTNFPRIPPAEWGARKPGMGKVGLENLTHTMRQWSWGPARDGRRSLCGVAAHRLPTAAGQGEAMDAVAPRARALALSMRPSLRLGSSFAALTDAIANLSRSGSSTTSHMPLAVPRNPNWSLSTTRAESPHTQRLDVARRSQPRPGFQYMVPGPR
jgi:hypothetical protein